MARKCIPEPYYTVEAEMSSCGGSPELMLKFVSELTLVLDEANVMYLCSLCLKGTEGILLGT